MTAASVLPDNFPGFVDFKPPPKDWHRSIDPMGPAFQRHHIRVRVSEHSVEGRRVRAVSVAAMSGLPNLADLDRVADSFLASGHGVISEWPPRQGSRMFMLTRSLDPVDPDSLEEIGAAMQREDRADVLISNCLRLKGSVGRNRTFVALFAIVCEALPKAWDSTIPALRAVKAIEMVIERAGDEEAKRESLLGALSRTAQPDLASERGDADAYRSALATSVWALMDYLQGRRDGAFECVRSAAKALTTGGAKTTVADEEHALRRLGRAARGFVFMDGDNPWFMEDYEEQVSRSHLPSSPTPRPLLPERRQPRR